MNIRDIMRRATQASVGRLDSVGSGGQSGGDVSPPSNDDLPAGNPIPSLAWPAEPMDSVDDDGLLGLGGNSNGGSNSQGAKDKNNGGDEAEKRKASLSALKVYNCVHIFRT